MRETRAEGWEGGKRGGGETAKRRRGQGVAHGKMVVVWWCFLQKREKGWWDWQRPCGGKARGVGQRVDSDPTRDCAEDRHTVPIVRTRPCPTPTDDSAGTDGQANEDRRISTIPSAVGPPPGELLFGISIIQERRLARRQSPPAAPGTDRLRKKNGADNDLISYPEVYGRITAHHRLIRLARGARGFGLPARRETPARCSP
jgi:hypothetical protein